MLIPRLRSLFSLKSSSFIDLSSSKFTSVKAASSSNNTLFAPFHSTAVLSEKSRKKSDSNSIKFTCTVKEKRSDTKKALNNLLLHTRGTRNPLQNEWQFGEPNRAIRHKQKKKTTPGRGKKPRNKKTIRWYREGSLDDDLDIDTTYKATFANKFREGWSQTKKTRDPRDSRPHGFEWREGWNWTTQSQRKKNWDTNEYCDEEDCLIIGSRSERSVLGLPLTGPLKISDVKNAFRSSAMKWHPDKHQGDSQVAAQEKFKVCVDAYKSLCSALS